MLSSKLLNIGDVTGLIYEFSKAGDELPKHIHDENTVHFTIVARGRLKIYSHDWEIEVSAGDVINFLPDQPHAFLALEDGTKVVNIVKKYRGMHNDTDYVG